MKISCPSCSAKYSIADEKVSDRLAKIRCRKCGATIVIDGKVSPANVYTTSGDADAAHEHAPDAVSGGEYSVDFGEGDQRNLPLAGRQALRAQRRGTHRAGQGQGGDLRALACPTRGRWAESGAYRTHPGAGNDHAPRGMTVVCGHAFGRLADAQPRPVGQGCRRPVRPGFDLRCAEFSRNAGAPGPEWLKECGRRPNPASARTPWVSNGREIVAPRPAASKFGNLAGIWRGLL